MPDEMQEREAEALVRDARRYRALRQKFCASALTDWRWGDAVTRVYRASLTTDVMVDIGLAAFQKRGAPEVHEQVTRLVGAQLDTLGDTLPLDEPPPRLPSGHPLAILAEEVVAINRANGWDVLLPNDWADVLRVCTCLALVHSEVSEALEAVRTGDRASFEEELADVVIRVLDTAGGLGIDLDAAVAAKLAKNRMRGYRHGGKKV